MYILLEINIEIFSYKSEFVKGFCCSIRLYDVYGLLKLTSLSIIGKFSSHPHNNFYLLSFFVLYNNA